MKSPSMKNFFLWELYKNSKTKSENIMILRMRQITHVNLLVCVPARAHAIAPVSGK